MEEPERHSDLTGAVIPTSAVTLWECTPGLHRISLDSVFLS